MENFWIKKLSDERDNPKSSMTAWMDMDSDPSVFHQKLKELIAASGVRKVVAVRALAEAIPDAEFLSRNNVAINVRALTAEGMRFELLIRHRPGFESSNLSQGQDTPKCQTLNPEI